MLPISPILFLKVLPTATSLKRLQNKIPGYNAHTPINPENLVKIGPVFSEIWGLEVDH